MDKIKFGTDGWRAIIADQYTVKNVARVAQGTANWLNENGGKHVIIGHDCRFAGDLFAKTAARVLAQNNIKVSMAQGFVSTPMVSLGVVHHSADLGIVITASHNPPSYNGFKIKSNKGGPATPSQIAEVEARIPDQEVALDGSFDHFVNEGKIDFSDLESLYIDHVQQSFDMELISKSGLKIATDSMFGAAQNVFKKLFPEAVHFHAEENPSFQGQAPEPIHKNLHTLSHYIANHSIDVGIATDGDADRIGMYNACGEFVDSHRILLLLVHYLKKYKNMEGSVAYTFSVSNKLKQLAAHYELNTFETKIGFKYISELMNDHEIMVGGEESGGLAVAGHIPERDGVWIGLTLLEFMAKTGKSLDDLVEEVYDIVGKFEYDRDDLHVTPDQKASAINHMAERKITKLNNIDVQEFHNIDGFKLIFDDHRWLLVRPSGTEPVLRVYAQAPSKEEVRLMLDDARKQLLA